MFHRHVDLNRSWIRATYLTYPVRGHTCPRRSGDYLCLSASVWRCLFAYELRLERDGKFYPGIDVETQWVDRDEKMIRELVAVAEQLQQNLVYLEWDALEMIESEWGEAPREESSNGTV